MDASPTPYAGAVPDNVQLIHESPRMGMVKGYNHAFKLCRGEFVLWLNDDAEVLPGYDSAGVNLLRTYPEVGMGAYYYKEGPRFHVNMLYRMIFANFGIIRNWLGNQIGWFDDELTMYGSDNSITFKVLLAGFGVVTVPGPNIIHHSEQDDMRRENEPLRKTDGDKLNARYSSRAKEMQEVYNRFRHLIGPRNLAV